MEAIILAGGLGTRLRQILPDLPKPMAPIGGHPFLEILLTSLSRKGFCRVVLSLGYMAEKISGHFGASFAGMELVYEVERSPLGTGGALRQALGRCKENYAFVFNGDTYLDLDFPAVNSYWKKHAVPIIVAREVSDTSRYGRLNAIDGRVVSFSEKGTSGPGLINAGCYILPNDILDGFIPGIPFSFENDFLVRAVSARRFDLIVADGDFIDIGVPEDYNRAQTKLATILG